jgi:transcriptional regulator GlxA family with amidase domain
MKARSDRSLIGVVVYEGVEPIDVGGTVGVISMAKRVIPHLDYVVLAEKAGPVKLAGGLIVLADTDFTHAPLCDTYVVTGGPGWPEQTENRAMLDFLRSLRPSHLASVCTGALILAASGQLAGKAVTTRRNAVGLESNAPIDLLAAHGQLSATPAAAIVDDNGTITSGGVSLAIDGTLYILGKLYGEVIRDEIASIIEYDRAFAANRKALQHLKI